MSSNRPIDPGTATLVAMIAVAVILFWAGVIWFTGLYDWLRATVTKDVLGYIAAGLIVIVTLGVLSFKRR